MGIQTQSTTRVDNTSTLSSCSYLHVLLAVQSEAADGLDLSVGRSSRRALEAELDWGGKLRVQLIGQISHHAQGVLQTLNTQTGNKKWISVKRATETNGLKAASLSHRADSDELQTLKAQKATQTTAPLITWRVATIENWEWLRILSPSSLKLAHHDIPFQSLPPPLWPEDRQNLFLLTSCFLSPSLLYDALLQFYIFALFNNSTETISEE